ncbi:exocyst complex component EXO70B1-like [Prosopis cineraria]|uniref:exocyst complex component EXO70B1-like n=1 Tax=Prosopis cineraria TaxID=364024 RepID=UPI00241048C5|nr:exocyst complex component EXO70B1-like [Prosopis cineraria]
MAESGEEKLLAMARHIAKTLAQDNSMADDILKIFSNFDGRFSREKLSEISGRDHRRGYASLENTLSSLDRRISHYVSFDQPIWADSADAAAFLEAIDELIATLGEWSPMAADETVGEFLVRADDMLQQAMFRAEDEFRSLIESGGESFDLTRADWKNESTRNLPSDSEEDEDAEVEAILRNDDDDDDPIPLARPVADYDVVVDALPSGTIQDLHEIAKRMAAAGFGKECAHVYSSCRREFVEESLSRLGLQKLSIEDVHKMPWQELEDEIARWIKASNVCLRILFPSEQRICNRVFFGFSSASDISFMEICRGSTLQLLNFADAIAIGSRSPERLFRILDVFETLRDLIPEFESLFSDEYSVFLRNEAITIWNRLGEAIRGIFMELENLIRRDPAKAAVPGGGLHPITRYVMNYLRAACRSRQTLEQVFEDNGPPLKDYTKLDENNAATSSLSVQMAWIMELLESNLEAKSKIYKEPGLCSVFMMNNGRYIVQKARDTELGTLLGDDWIRKHTAKVRQHHVSYQRSSWSKVLGLLKLESGSLSSNIVVKSMKEKIKYFNMQFEDICRVQSSWIIYDDQLREEIRIALERILLPAYGNFINRFENIAELGKHPEKYIKYGVEDIEAKLQDLFNGKCGSAGSRRGR